jgi:signal transduction histidine kinase/ligand-binding sensor domain-containing protein/CheY-like chemotaxis protein/HPt (histidine-containing phosphotransfer) domain-containing protein
MSWPRSLTGFLTSTLVLCALASVVRAAEPPSLVVARLSTLEGLPQGTVMATLQDSQGFVWLGTEDGLVRFDGHEVHRYGYLQSAKSGLPGNFVNAIVEDSRGDLWIGLKGAGLARWNRSTDAFTSYRHDARDPNSLSSDAVRTLLIDSMGRIWIGTLNAGLNVLEPTSGHIAHLRYTANAPVSLSDDAVITFMQERGGIMWVGTKRGIDRLTFDGNRFRRASPTAGESALVGKLISQIVTDQQQAVWVGTEDAGLYQLGPQAHATNYTHNANAVSLASNDVRAVLQDRAGHLWVGTEEGLDMLDPTTHEFRHFHHDRANPDSLSDSAIMSLYEDESGLLWIGTKSGGVDRFNPHSWELGGNRPAWLDGKLVTSFADAADGGVWVGSRGGGLRHIDRNTGEALDIDTLLKSTNVLGDRRIMSLRLDAQGTLWVGTMTEGMKRLSADGKISSVAVARGDAHSLSSPGIMTIYESRRGLLWIGTHGGGANILDPATGLIRQLPYGANIAGAVSSENVMSFTEDALGNMWIGTEDGLDLATPEGVVVRVFHHSADNSTSLPADAVYSLVTDGSNQVWVATDGGGLSKVIGNSSAPALISFKGVGSAEGLPLDTIYGVLTDASGGLWISGNSGLFRYDAVTHEVRSYHREDGLQGEEFNSGAYIKTRDGRLCFGGTEGYNIFRPEALSPRRNAPRVVLTEIEILGVPAAVATPVWLLHKVSLDYPASIVSFDFAALDFASPNRSRIKYKIAGLSDVWINLDSQRRLTLTNLAAGDYLLEVLAANADSVWSAEPLRLAIHKDAAPWRSQGAYAGYVIAVLGLILFTIWSQRKKWRQAGLAQDLLEKQVTLRTVELQDTNQRLLVANDAKSRFLARMSHELRTPMNGVVGMTELLERTPLTAVQARQTQTIKASANTLLQILNDLLELSKAQAGKIELESLPLDLTKLAEECASLFASTAESKGLEVIVCPPRGNEWQLHGDAFRIRQILMNLIANAVKFTANGEIVVDCSIVSQDPATAVARIAISDTGIGLSADVIDKIFDPFTQADETTTRRFGGSGLGLSICAELVKLMGGAIQVTSLPKVGSTFVVTLPLRASAIAASQRPQQLRGQAVNIVSRRPSLIESLTRYVSVLGPSSINAQAPPIARPLVAGGVILWDADSGGAALCSWLTDHPTAGASMVVIGTAAALEEHPLQRFLVPGQILTKPIYGDALHVAMAAAVLPALGASESLQAKERVNPSLGGHVLVVEDEAVNAAVAQGYLTELGCTHVWVADGTGAIARAAVERFDLILMDLNMPGLDGFATASAIRAREKTEERVPIVALTATEAQDCRDRCLIAGMDDVLSKPYSYAECEALLRALLPSRLRSVPDTSRRRKGDQSARIDRSVVAVLRSIGVGGDRPLFDNLIGIFTRSSAQALKDIESALAAGEFDNARAFCHKIKSAAANVGAMGFAELLEELEGACRAGEATRARQLHVLCVSTREAVLASLEHFRAERSA